MKEDEMTEGMFCQAVLALPYPVCIIGPDMLVAFSNSAMDRVFGLGKPKAALPKDALVIAEKAQKTQKEVREKITMTVFGSRTVQIPVKAVPLFGPVAGKPGPVLLTFEISGEEDPLLETLVRENSQRKLRDLLSAIRHDILNQLTILIGFLQYSEELCEDPRIRDFIKKEENAGKSIQSLIEFTRKFQDLAVQEPGWFDLSMLVKFQEVQNLPRNVRFVIDCDHFEVFSTPLLASVFSILVGNALDHATGLSRITIAAAVHGDELVIVVEDDGPGILQTEKKMLFERGHGRQMGYSLWLAGEIVGICGATIRECGKEGEGARFEIRIPAGLWRKKDEPAPPSVA